MDYTKMLWCIFLNLFIVEAVDSNYFGQYPKNQVGYLEDRVEFKCKINLFTFTREFVEWAHHPVEGGVPNVISSNGKVRDHLKYTLEGRHEVGEFHLNVHQLSPSDNGWYSCTYKKYSKTGVQVLHPQKYARLIAIEKATCHQAKDANTYREHEPVTLTFTLLSNISWPMSYIVTSSSQNSLAHKDYSSWRGQSVTEKVKATAEMTHHGVNFNIVFSKPTQKYLLPGYPDVDNLFDMEAPNFTASCNVPMDVLYGPRNVTVSKPEDVLMLDDTIICNANSNPTPKFIWVRLSGPGQERVNAGKTITVTREMVGWNNTYLCLAENYIEHSRYLSSHEVSFVVAGEKLLIAGGTGQNPHPDVHISHPLSITTIAIAAYAALVSVLLGIVVACILWRKRPRKKFVIDDGADVELSEGYKYEGRVWKEPINDLQEHRKSIRDEMEECDRYSQIEEPDSTSLIEGQYTPKDTDGIPTTPLLEKKTKPVQNSNHNSPIHSYNTSNTQVRRPDRPKIAPKPTERSVSTISNDMTYEDVTPGRYQGIETQVRDSLGYERPSRKENNPHNYTAVS